MPGSGTANVVGKPGHVMSYNTLTFSGIYAFVILKDGVTDSDEEMAQSLKKLVRKKIGSFAVPQLVMVRDRK